jgi:hypothetical protein
MQGIYLQSAMVCVCLRLKKITISKKGINLIGSGVDAVPLVDAHPLLSALTAVAPFLGLTPFLSAFDKIIKTIGFASIFS